MQNFSIRYSALRYFGGSTGTVQVQLRFVRDGLRVRPMRMRMRAFQ